MKLKFFAGAILCGALVLLAPQTAHAEEVVPITYNGMATDSFQGIEANYIMGTGNSNTGAYCCAGYVIKFYKELYGVDTYNINTVWGMPTVVKAGHEVHLEEVSTPKPGDMMQSLTYSHVGIVKRVENGKAILIEQNYKWWQNGQTVASVEREVGFDEAHFYRLVIDGEEMVFDDENKLPGSSFEALTQMPSITGEDITTFQQIINETQNGETPSADMPDQATDIYTQNAED